MKNTELDVYKRQEYTIEDGKYLVYNAYSHRMNIEVD